MVRTHTKKIAAFMSVVTMLYLMMMYFPSGMLGIDFGLTASAAEITLTEPSTDSNGVYQIGSAAELYWFADKINNDNATYASANAALTANINLHGSETNQWTPIGNDTNQFKGIFDGGGHRITGLYISSTSNYQGLFGYLGSGGMIKSLGVDGSVSGGSNVGGVCGYNKGGTITGCYNTGAVTGTNKYTGGVCGDNSGTITGCYNTGAVTGGSFVGGVCGPNSGTITGCYNSGTVSGTFSDALESGSKTVGGVCSSNSSTITGCYNTGAVTGTNKYTGGVCGSNSGTISGCYNTGAVTGTVSYNSDEAVVGGDDTTRGVGGVCGYNYGSTIESCYNTGAVTGTSDYVGGVCGYNKTYTTIIGNTYTGTTTGCYNIGTVTCSNIFSTNVGGVCGYNGGTTEDCYYLSGCKGTLTTFNSVGTAISVAEFTNHTNFSGWDFSATWKMSDYLERPILSSVPEIKGDGTEMQPYLISDLASLERLRDDVNGGKDYSGVYFALTADIYMSGTYNSTSGKSWTPIGNDKNQFKGIFNGGGHKIIGLYISGTSNYQGLFGYLGEGGMIKSLGVDGSVSGGTDVGGVCGYNGGTITGCYNTAAVTGTGVYVGGVCGRITAGTITGCYNTGTVSGAGNFVGGVGGYNSAGTITGCYNTAAVTGTGVYVGGVCGDNISKIQSCYNTGTVTGSNDVGGVCGYNEGGTITGCYNTGTVSGADVGGVCGGNLGTITGCYNTGTVSGNSYIGGVCGVNFNSSTITGCYNIGTVSGAGNFVGGVGGLNGGGTITGCYNTGTVSSTSEYVGGVCGRNNSGKITKCYNTAAVTGSGTNVGGVCGYNYITGATITRCYYDSDKCKVGGITGADTANKAEGKTSKQFASGEVCYLLNGGRITLLWGQTIGKESGNDAYPVFHNDTNTVYYGYADCSAADKTYSNSALHETMGHKYNGENHACSYCGNAFAVIEVNYAKLENALTDIYNVDSDGNVGKKADITVDKDTGVVTCLIKVNGDKALIDTYTLNISASEGETNPITIEKTKYKKRSGENSINIDMVQLVNELANGSYTATLILYDADGNDICIINADFAVSSGTISAG